MLPGTKNFLKTVKLHLASLAYRNDRQSRERETISNSGCSSGINGSDLSSSNSDSVELHRFLVEVGDGNLLL